MSIAGYEEYLSLHIPTPANFPSLGDIGRMASMLPDDDDGGENCYDDCDIESPKKSSRCLPQESLSNGNSEDDGRGDCSSSCDSNDYGINSFTHLYGPDDDNFDSELRPEYVRWFYKQDGDRKWTPFLGFDSLRMEFKYRQLTGSDLEVCRIALQRLDKKEMEFLESGKTIVVRGGLYEADLTQRTCSSIYWAGEVSVILRGTWFYDGTWQPLQESVADQLEEMHLNIFKDNQVSNVSVDSNKKGPQVVHSVQFPEFLIEWHVPNEVYLYSEATSSKFMRSVTQKFGFQKSTGYKLQRGFYGDATLADRQPDITHLVFVVHGVGQKIDSKRIIRNCGSLRNCANWLKERYFSHLQVNKERSEFFPVEWRSSLKLDGDTVDSITPHRVRGLRDFLNSSAMDIMYYTSPTHRREIIQGLRDELNRLYVMFCERNPYFEARGGKVSVVAHSLGCVIMYDILTNWKDSHQFIHQNTESSESHNGCNEAVSDPEKCSQHAAAGGLHFKVENQFCLGSPLAVFLALRGVRPGKSGTQDNILPRRLVNRLFNIYHPADPVAYRLEPLVLKHYSSIMPLRMHHYGDKVKTPYELMPPEMLKADGSDKRPNSPLTDDSIASPVSPVKSSKGESRWSFAWPSWVRRKDSAEVPHIGTSVQSHSDDEDLVHDGCKPPTWYSNPTLTSDGDEFLTPVTSEEQEIHSISLDSETCFGNSHSLPASVVPSPKHSIATDLCLITSMSDDPPDPLSVSESPEIPEDSKTSEDSEPVLETTDLEFRLDYMIREGNLESSYISALTSHTAYWTSYDTAFFILSYLHPNPTPSTDHNPDMSSPSPTPSPANRRDV